MEGSGFAEKARKAKNEEYKRIREGRKRGTDPKTWKPVSYEAKMPETGIFAS